MVREMKELQYRLVFSIWKCDLPQPLAMMLIALSHLVDDYYFSKLCLYTLSTFFFNLNLFSLYVSMGAMVSILVL